MLRHLLALLPVDRPDIDRHAATIRSLFATRAQRLHTLTIAAIMFALAMNAVALFIIVEGGQ